MIVATTLIPTDSTTNSKLIACLGLEGAEQDKARQKQQEGQQRSRERG